MVTYEIMEENFFNPQIGNYTSYGIVAYENSAQNVLYSISDVFLDRQKADKYIQLFNEMELDIIHLPNVIEELLQYA